MSYGGVVDLISSDEDEEVSPTADDEEEGTGDKSFLTADNNEPIASTTKKSESNISLPISPIAPHSDVKESDKRDIGIQDSGADVTTAAAVSTVLNAYKGRLSAKDFEQLQLIMGKDASIEKERHIETVALSCAEEDVVDKNRNKGEKERDSTRLSFEGGSWTSRESFLPPSPLDRFAIQPISMNSNSLLGPGSLTSVSENIKIGDIRGTIQNENIRKSSTEYSQAAAAAGRNGNNVRFSEPEISVIEKYRIEKERERNSILPNGGSSNHIRYGPVTFMRRPMTPFASRSAAPVPSPSPSPAPYFSPYPRSNSLYEGASSSFQRFTNGNEQLITSNNVPSYQQQQLQSDLPFPLTEELQRKRRYEDSRYSDM